MKRAWKEVKLKRICDTRVYVYVCVYMCAYLYAIIMFLRPALGWSNDDKDIKFIFNSNNSHYSHSHFHKNNIKKWL